MPSKPLYRARLHEIRLHPAPHLVVTPIDPHPMAPSAERLVTSRLLKADFVRNVFETRNSIYKVMP